MKNPKFLVSVVVPVYNEEQNLPNFYRRMKNTLDDLAVDAEVIFINDGSKDRSWSIIRELSQRDPCIKGINLSRNSGSYAAIEAGLRGSRGTVVMCISADLQDPPEILKEFLPKWQEGHHIVWGVREGRDDPRSKKILASIFYSIVRKIAFQNFPQDGMDIGLFERMIVDRYLQQNDRNTIPFFSIYAMGFRQAFVPYFRRARVVGESGWPFWKRVKCAIDVAVDFSYVPIRLISIVGIISAIIAIAYGILVIGLSLFTEKTTSGWSSIAVMILFTSGVQMFFMGVIAEYLWRTSDRVKNRPTFFVMEDVGFQSELEPQDIRPEFTRPFGTQVLAGKDYQ